jgi:hypothetical protein
MKSLVRRIIEARIQAALSSHDPKKTGLKQWLVVAHQGENLEEKELFRYQFHSNPNSALEKRLQAAMQDKSKQETEELEALRREAGEDELDLASTASKKETPTPPSLLDVMLDESDVLLKTAREAAWYQKLWRRMRYGKYYPQYYRNQSQDYYKESFEIFNIYQKLPDQALPAALPLKLKWYHNLLIWCAKKVELTWEFKSNDFIDHNVFFEKVKKHERTQKKNGGVIAEAMLANTHSTLDNPNTPSIRESHTVEQWLSGDPHMQGLILDRMQDKRKEVQAETTPRQAPQEKQTQPLDQGAIPLHMRPWVTTLTLTHSIEHNHQHIQQQNVQQEQQVEIDRHAELERAQAIQRWTDSSAQRDWQETQDELKKQHDNNEYWMQLTYRHLQSAYREALGTAYNKDRAQSFQAVITDNAKQALLALHGSIRPEGHTFDLESLPPRVFY